MQEVDGGSSIPAVLEEARQFTRRGQYAAAERILQEALACHHDNLELTFELAETYTTQGYINRAFALVDRHAIPEGAVFGDLLRMLACFLAPMVSGRFTASIEEADRIISTYDVIEPSETAFMPVATLRLLHFKTLALYSVFHHSDGTARMEASQTGVVTIISKMLSVGDAANAFKFSNVLLDKGRKQEILESLIEMEDCSPLTKAKAQAELAELFTKPDDRHLRDQLRVSARQVLEAEHSHAALDIDVICAIEELQGSPERPTKTDIDSLLRAYRTLNYPNGLKMWLHRLLDIATSIHDLEAQHGLEEELKALSTETGTFVFLLTLRVNNIARFHQNTGYDDLVKTTLLDIYHDLVEFQVPFTLGQVGFILTDHFVRLRDAARAQIWADRCASHWESCSPAIQSVGNLQRLRAEILRFEESSSADHEAVQTLCEEFVATDLARELRQEAVMKLDLMPKFFYFCKRIPLDERFSHIHRYLTRSEGVLDSITDSDTRHQKAALLQQQATFRIFHGSHRTDVEMEQSAIELFRQALELTHAASNQTLTFQLVTIREQMGLAYQACFGKLLLSDKARARGYLDAAEECFSVCLTGRTCMGTTAQIAEDKYWIALLRYEKRIQGWAVSDEVLQSLLEAEAAFDALRIEISISSGMSAIKGKQALARQKHVRDIYRFAFQVCVLDGDAASAWEWVQKAKARSLSDMLGLGCVIPENLLSRIKTDDSAKELYERELELSQQLKSLPAGDSFSTVIELRRLQSRMRSIAVLREMLDLRQGKAVTAKELLLRWEKLPVRSYVTNVAFIDWYMGGDDEVYVLILLPAADIILRKVNATAHEVRAWIKEYLLSEDGQRCSIGRSDEHPGQALRALDTLVEVIGDHVNEGVLLVLSPAAPLDALPLHALHLRSSNEQQPKKPLPLIERNPVVYCSNMTVFLQCCETAASKPAKSDLKASLMAVYEETSAEPFNEIERQVVYNYMRDLASDYGTSAVVGLDVSRSRIFVEWPQADYILFHGHCDVSSQDITEQSLILAPATASVDAVSAPHLAVKDVFDLKLEGPLVAMMACSSSSQKISAGDEPLGLVTALLCAGAASVVGTLWPVASGTARRFATIFGQQLRGLQEEPSSAGLERGVRPPPVRGMIDLAVAVQRTVRELKETGPRMTRTPSHWAAFVTHGSAFLTASV